MSQTEKSSYLICPYDYYHKLFPSKALMTLSMILHWKDTDFLPLPDLICGILKSLFLYSLCICATLYLLMARASRIVTCIFYLFSVVFISLSLLFFPLGLSSSFVHSICGPKSNMYKSGECQIAWGYVLSIMSTALLIFSPILARYSIEKADTGAELFATNYRPSKLTTAV